MEEENFSSRINILDLPNITDVENTSVIKKLRKSSIFPAAVNL